jgi:hypothetical protein
MPSEKMELDFFEGPFEFFRKSPCLPSQSWLKRSFFLETINPKMQTKAIFDRKEGICPGHMGKEKRQEKENFHSCPFRRDKAN